MSVNYYGVGGIGILITDDRINKFIESNLFSKKDWNDDPYECMDIVGISWVSGGDLYFEEYNFYFLVEGDNLEEINKNEKSFRNKLSKYGIFIQQKDLIVISDLEIS